VLSRGIAANSAAGISLILGICAAAWFTAGTTAGDLWGTILLGGSYLAWRAAPWLAAAPSPALRTDAVSPALRTDIVSPALLARVCWAAVQYAVYAGLAVGGAAAGWGDAWVVAVTVAILAGLRQTMSDCRGPRPATTGAPSLSALDSGALDSGAPDSGAPDSAPDSGAPDSGARGSGAPDSGAPDSGAPDSGARDSAAGSGAGIVDPQARAAWGGGEPGVVRSLVSAPLRLSAGCQVLFIAVAAPVWGPRTALYGLLAGAMVAVGYAAGGGRPGAGSRGPGQVSDPDPVPGAIIMACRDDGTFGRYLGRLVHGQIVPLPPAVAGLAAASVLAVLGLHDLPGILVLTPLVAMLLAAPGCSHPHDGRLDWLAPGLLQAGQCVYLAALGFATGVAPPVIFALCAVTAIRYAALGYLGAGQPAGRLAGRLDIGLGWEGRMLAAGLGVIAGLGLLAYLALTAYVGVLICSEVRTSCRATGEDGCP
jgi:hypothetical protein